MNPRILLALLLVLAACELPESPTSAHADLIGQLASPIMLNEGETTLYLDDYFVPMPTSIALHHNGSTLIMNPADHTVLIEQRTDLVDPETDELPNYLLPISVLEIKADGIEHDIPVFKSEKKRFKFRFTPDTEYSEVAIAGSLNGWNPNATPLTFNAGAWETELYLNEGIWEYQLVVDGEWILDPTNTMKRSNGQGGHNSMLTVGNPKAARPNIRAVSAKENTIVFEGTSGANAFIWWENQLIAHKAFNGEKLLVSVPEVAIETERSHIRAFICDEEYRGNDLLIPLHNGRVITDTDQLTRHDHHRQNMYFILTDRFEDGDPNNNFPVDDPQILPIANHHGGDFQGILNRIESGYFDQLGINTLWLSPITTNASGAWGLWDEGVRSKFSGYHGYWPVRSREIDRNFGDEAVFETLITALHDRDMNILIDYVANHVHEEHPIYQQHPDWATDLYLPDSTLNTERWDEYRLTTWFDTFLPTLDLERQEITEALTDTAMFWVENFAIDGFRHDATKHIPENFWRTLTRKVKSELRYTSPHRTIFQIGETYGSPELINSYVNSGMLDAQFDFNLYDASVAALADSKGSFRSLADVLYESLQAYGHHHLMGNISGNQDRARFISYADGSVAFDEDAKLAGWTRDIENLGGDSYSKLIMLHAFNQFVPGVPCLYYGDEIALPGGNDPDNRRMMQFDDLSDDQRIVRDAFSELAQIRKSNMALLYGQTKIVAAHHDCLTLKRVYFDEKIFLEFFKNDAFDCLVEFPKGAEVLFEHIYYRENNPSIGVRITRSPASSR